MCILGSKVECIVVCPEEFNVLWCVVLVLGVLNSDSRFLRVFCSVQLGVKNELITCSDATQRASRVTHMMPPSPGPLTQCA